MLFLDVQLVNSNVSIPRLVIDQWSSWSIAACVVFTIIILTIDILYGFFKGTQLRLLHAVRYDMV